MKRPLNTYLLCIITGIAYGLSFPPLDLNFLVFFAFASCCYILSECTSAKEVFKRFYVIYISFGLVAVSWLPLSGMQESADRFLIIAGILTLIVHPLFFVLPAVLSYPVLKAGRKLGLSFWLCLLPFPVIYTAFEFVQTLGEVNFPWLSLAYSHTYLTSKVQYIDITGIAGASLWICLTGYLLYLSYTAYKGKQINKAAVLFASALLLYFAPDIYNLSAKPYSQCAGTGEKVRIAILQPNINPWKKWESPADILMGIYKDQIREAALQKPDLIILPETAVPFDLLDTLHSGRYYTLKNLIDSVNIPVLTGYVDRVYQSDPANTGTGSRSERLKSKYITYNSAVLILPRQEKNSFIIHNKAKLVPGGERIPYNEYLTFLKDFTAWDVGVSGFGLGNDTSIFRLPSGVTLSTAICYESVYPEFVSDYSEKGSDFITIITNDGWYGKLFGPYQHNQYAVMRAIENRRWVARSANTGISCTISPCGEMINPTPLEVRTVLAADIEVRKDITFYAQHDDIFAKTLLTISFLLFIPSIIFLYVKRKQ